MVVSVLLFLLGLVMLIKGGDWFVDGSSGIARKFHVPEILIGATVVSIGTTLPEVMVSATSAVTGQGDMAYGNAIGSIICNTALILALTITIRPSKVDRKSFLLPVIFFFIAAGFYVFNGLVFKSFSRLTGICLLAIFLVYMMVSIVRAKNKADDDQIEPPSADKTDAGEMPIWKLILLLVVGAALIAIGAKLMVENGTVIARYLGIPESVIALTIVALGTSLPELVTAITALVKGHSALSLGNIIGANLFNLVLVTGVSASLAPFSIPVSKTVAGMNASLVVDTPVMLFVMLFMAIPALVRQKLSRVQGIVLLAVYAAFCVFQFLY